MFDRLSPVFPVRDIDLAVEHYRKLGFTVRMYEGPDPNAFAERDGIEFHLAQVDNLEPSRNMTAVTSMLMTSTLSMKSGTAQESTDD